MSFDHDIYELICKHASEGESPVNVIAVLGSHITLLIQSFCASPEAKLEIAKGATDCIINEIKTNPHPLKEKLN